MLLTDRVFILARTATTTALGETVTWQPVQKKYARVIPLGAQARAAYQQLKSEVTHKVIFEGSVNLTIADNRLLWKGKTLEPVEPPQEMGHKTVIMMREV